MYTPKLLCRKYPGVSEDPRTTKAAQTEGELRPPCPESHGAPAAHRQVGKRKAEASGPPQEA
ncbi:unnamed protein product [Tetraodon nigroviridis]|uniref:(spotted green pufferfish) hypothetical protein n=1 Tax=Tetraodon nigroviridis TaxID=99883 RepID=Q4T6H1_TETNG|nr:unnamed protein product [Tetraodon nigroviridis]